MESSDREAAQYLQVTSLHTTADGIQDARSNVMQPFERRI